MKKTLSVILSVIILITSLSIGFTAFAQSSSGSMRNPFYTGEFVSNKSSLKKLRATNANEPDYYTHNGKKYYTKNDVLYKIIRDALGARKSIVHIRLFSEYRIFSFEYNKLIENLLVEATEDRLSVSSTDGDYARWSISNYGWNKMTYDSNSKGYYYDIDLTYEYYSSEEQENKANAKINSIVQSVRKKNFSDYEAIKYIYDLICDNTTYDYDAAKYANSSIYDYAFTAYGALCAGLSVCQGYASAFYRICRELGYKVRFVSSDPGVGCHAWNLIQLDDKFYFVDATWDDEIRDDEELTIGFDNNLYFFFLVDYDSLRTLDSNNREHTLYNELYDNDYYNDNFRAKTSKQPYDYKTATGLSTCKISLSNTKYVYNGEPQTPTIKVLDKNSKEISDYSVSYSNPTNCGRTKITIKGKNSYSNSVTYRTYIITPSKMTNLSYVSDSRTKDSLSLKWSKYAGGANGYEIQQYKDGNWKTVKTVGNVTNATITGLSSSSTVKFRIRAYKAINAYKHYGIYSSTYTTVTKPSNVKAPTLSTKSRAITVKWTKVNCSGYEIKLARNSSMNNAKIYNASYTSSSKKIKSLKKGRRYYVRVRAYKQYDGKKYYSAWSSKKSIIVK